MCIPSCDTTRANFVCGNGVDFGSVYIACDRMYSLKFSSHPWKIGNAFPIQRWRN